MKFFNSPRLPNSLPVRARTQTGNGGQVCALCPAPAGLNIKTLFELGLIIETDTPDLFVPVHIKKDVIYV